MTDGERPRDGNHALVTGAVLGTFMRAGLMVSPDIDEHGDYLDTMIVTLPKSEYGFSKDLKVKIKVLDWQEQPENLPAF